MCGYLYVIHEREFIRTNECVYKFGRSHDIITRFNQYPKGSRLLFCVTSNDPVLHERIVLYHLRNLFKNRRDIGAEYFECDISLLLSKIFELVELFNSRSHVSIESTQKTHITRSTQTSLNDINIFAQYAYRC
jgi:hypothetical protein